MHKPKTHSTSAPGDLANGTEWVVDAFGCSAAKLRDAALLGDLLDRVVAEVRLHLATAPLVHAFGGPGGVTLLYLMQESHLACHTFPENGYASFNLYCCKPRRAWPWAHHLQETLNAKSVNVRRLERGKPAQNATHAEL